MTPDALAALHALGFTDTPRPWTALEFAALLQQPTTLLAATSDGFALGRVAGLEVELLTLVVHPDARRCGVASTLLGMLEAEAARRGAEDLLLEVAVTNGPARALYAGLGFQTVGRRPRYYVRVAAPPVDALVLRKRIDPAPRGKTI